MVYVGPSTGCYLCRKRKIKCSEEKPGCRNCKIYGADCPGYRPVSKNATLKARKPPLNKARAGRIAGAEQAQPREGNLLAVRLPSDALWTRSGSSLTSVASSASSSSSSSSSSYSSFSSSSGSSDTNGLASLLSYRMADSTWEERSFVYFIQQYTTAGDWDQSVSHLSFLPNLYAKCQEKASSDAASACFRLAVDAAAQVALGHEARAPSLISKARRNYGKALGALQQLLNTHSQAVKDETLAAVVVISLFEDISGDRNGLSGSHTTGFELLIKLRGRGQLDYPQGRDLFNYAYANTHIEILALGDKPRLDMEWIIAALDVSDPIPRLITTSSKISQFFVKVSSAQAAMQAQLFVSPALVIGQLATWLEYARGLDRDLVRWCDGLPEEWIPSVIPSPTGEQLLITYPRISVATIWNYYRAVRIVMQQILTGLQGALAPLASLSNISPNLSSSALSSTQVVVHDMIDEICRSIPFALGDIDPRGRFTADPARPWASQPSSRHKFKAVHGYSLLWPLWYVLSCGLATPDQSKQVRTALARLGSEVGIKLALTLAEGAPGSPPSQWGDHP